MARRRTEPSRLETFSDAVFAFAATLLVVSLQVPMSFEELIADLSGFGAFAVSFAALVLIWSVHNAYFRRYGIQDGWTVALNACLLFVVLFYVFPLKFIAAGLTGHMLGLGDPGRLPSVGSAEELRTLFILYSVGFVLIFAFVALMYRHASRRRSALELDALEMWEARFLMRHYGLFAVVGLISVGVAMSGVWLAFGSPGLIYFLLGPLCWWHGVWSERSKPVNAS